MAAKRSTDVSNDRITLHATPNPDEHGAYVFVTTPKRAGKKRLTLTVTYRDGTTCRGQPGTAC